MIRRYKLLLSVLSLMLISSCSRHLTPDLEWLYAAARDHHSRPPLILIHGLLGSRLKDSSSGKEVWPGAWHQLLLSSYPDLALPISAPASDAPMLVSQLRADDLFDASFAGDYYQRIRQILEGPGGYVPGKAGTPPDDKRPRYYVFSYDWRQDSIVSAAALEELILQIQSDYNNPDLQVDIIAHSLGGLVARYYARYGSVDLLNGNDFPVTMTGADNIRRMVLLGTPNLGSVSAIMAFVEGSRPGLRLIPPETMMTMPSVYQLFPHALNNWLVTADGDILERDQFDALIWQRFQIGPWDPALAERLKDRPHSNQAAPDYLASLQAYFAVQLERARRFTWSLTVAQPQHPMRTILLGGDCAPTPAKLLVEEIHGESQLRLWPQHVQKPDRGIDYSKLMLEPGDGTVTKASLLGRDTMNPAAARHRHINFRFDSDFFLCERHDSLTGNVTFQNNLLDALMRID